MNSNNLLIVFARTPRSGCVKTRLAKSIGNQAALWIYQKLLNKTSETILSKQYHTAFFIDSKPKNQSLIHNKPRYIQTQKGETFGQRMENAILWGFDKSYKKVIIIGSDLWDIKMNLIENAFTQLEHNDFVIGPSLDGGYYLLGQKRHSTSLFENICWGSSVVFDQTINKISDKKVFLLEPKNDIDTFEDLKKEKELYNLYKNTL